MPPSSTPEAGVADIEVLQPETIPSVIAPPSTNTQALLHSLEELRDSLSIRVSQLATAVERLREQAGQLERSIGNPPGGRRSFSGSLQIPERTITHAVDMPPRTSPSDPPHISTSAIATEISNLDRPITSAEIHRLLDRASASLAVTPDLSAAEMEGTIDGLREVRDSLQGGLRDLTEMGETQTRLRQRLRTRWERISEPREVRPSTEGEVRRTRGARETMYQGETMHQEAQRRLAGINAEAEKRRAGLGKGRKDRAARMEREGRAQRPDKPSTLPPTMSTTSRPTIVRTPGVTPPPARPAFEAKPIPVTRAPPTPTTDDPTSAANRNSLSHLDAASLDALHSQIAELDLNLEPTEYMSGLSRIIRQAIHPHRTESADRVIEMIEDGYGSIIQETPSLWAPDSPASTIVGDHYVAGDSPDNGLTYRGRDVQDRIRAAPTPDLGGLLGEDAPAVRTLQDRVAAIMTRRPPPEVRADSAREHRPLTIRLGTPRRSSEQAGAEHYDRLDRMRYDRIQRAREIVQDSSRTIQDAARSARELVNAATAIREDTAERNARVADREAAYEIAVQSELRAVQANRSRAYNRYQDLVASRARREAHPPPPSTVPPPPPPLGRDIGIDAVISVVPVADVNVDDPTDLDEARQQFISAQMREAAVQQRLLWARSRLRRETPSTSMGTSERIAATRHRIHQFEGATAEALRSAETTLTGMAQSAETSGEGDIWERVRQATAREGGTAAGPRRTVGPRDERPEDVDTMVRIRQLQGERPGGPERTEARRRHLSNIRQDLTESRRRIRDAGAGSTIATASEDEGDPSIRQLLSDAQHVSDARRSLYDALDQDDWAVTPSSPITAVGNSDYSHIQISVGTTSTAAVPGEAIPAAGGRVSEEAPRVLQAVGEGHGRDEANMPRAENHIAKTELQTLNPAPVEDEAEIRAHMWPAAAGRNRRRERVYISMLDL